MHSLFLPVWLMDLFFFFLFFGWLVVKDSEKTRWAGGLVGWLAGWLAGDLRVFPDFG